MEMFGKVRQMYKRDKKSLREIAKGTGLSRNTIRKWVAVDGAGWQRAEGRDGGLITPFTSRTHCCLTSIAAFSFS